MVLGGSSCGGCPHLQPLIYSPSVMRLALEWEAQALTWRRADGEHPGAPVVCTVRNHVSIPVRENSLRAVSAIFHADLVLAAYVDPAEFRARDERWLSSRWHHLQDGETQAGADAVQQWSYLTGAANTIWQIHCRCARCRHEPRRRGQRQIRIQPRHSRA